MDIPATSDNIPGTLVLRGSDGSTHLNGVAINESDPVSELHISDTAVGKAGEPYPMISLELYDPDEVESVAAGVGPAIDFYVPDSTGGRLSRSQVSGRIATVTISSNDAVGSGDMTFSTAVNVGALTERVRIKSNGQTRFIPLASDPLGAEAGDVYYNSSSNKLKVYDGTSWVDLH